MAQLCLKWNNYEASIIQVFQEMYDNHSLVDVTIACERQYVKAHKLVLAACSPYFQELFMANPCKHPIVILKDVRYHDLKSLIEFMYRGEVTVSHEQLPSLLKTAEMLQIKQLAEMTTRPAAYEAASQALQRKKRKRPKTKSTSSSSIAAGDKAGESDNEKPTLIYHDSNGQPVITADSDGQAIQIDSGGESSRILEMSMAEVVGDGTGDGTHTVAVVATSDQDMEATGEEDEDSEQRLTSDPVYSTMVTVVGEGWTTEGQDTIMLIKKKQSFVWEYFTETGKGSVKCKKCGKLLSYKDTSGSTSNMIKHLKTVHGVERAAKPALQE